MAGKLNPRQISSFTNNKAVVELINKLKPATPGMAAIYIEMEKKMEPEEICQIL